jgi:L-threonylcarbamoyladenylate synthase
MKLLRWRWGDPVEPLVELLGRGGVLAIPTESSYGLAADPRSAVGVTAIFRIKGREGGKPLPVVVGEWSHVRHLGIDPTCDEIDRSRSLGPAALSVLVPLARPLPAAAGAARLAVRLPDHPRLLGLLRELGIPLTATSANRSGETPLVDPEAVADLLVGEDAALVDDGRLPGGPPSTLIAWEGGRLRVLRQGRLDSAEIRRRFSESTVEETVDF